MLKTNFMPCSRVFDLIFRHCNLFNKIRITRAMFCTFLLTTHMNAMVIHYFKYPKSFSPPAFITSAYPIATNVSDAALARAPILQNTITF